MGTNKLQQYIKFLPFYYIKLQYKYDLKWII
jgi:hypothetical protein